MITETETEAETETIVGEIPELVFPSDDIIDPFQQTVDSDIEAINNLAESF